ncbi:N-methyl-L-tryptophan oxidase [Aquibacillus saliphilus]|uniref:N-methyl-L-tryptophan oxidase n=1 Tax=Aquibacillus saliphilus TaxID=1909422 RepID=UPI001CF04417|nr:N-methyl-L-tryptophan oxidase [Aquibacillus saliphilus]
MNYDVIIIGAGSMGMAAGYYLTNKGKQVLLLDAYDPPHAEGSHHGETRIIRHAYGEGDSYVPMALRAQSLWLDLQTLIDRELFIQTGVLNVGKPESEFIRNIKKSANTYALSVEELTTLEINDRWKGFNVPKGLIGYYEKNSGILLSEDCIRAYRDLAVMGGATLKTHSPVREITHDNNRVIVKTKSEVFTGDSLIVTAGSGTPKILSLIGLESPLQVVRKTFSWFDSDESIYSAENFPAFAFDLPTETYYGFPGANGSGVKIGRNDGGYPISDPNKLKEFGNYQEDKQDVIDFSSKYLSDVKDHSIGKTCTYTNTPDGNFIIDKHPNHNNVLIACGFSGHGFKFSSVIGEILSQLNTEGKSDFDLRQFSMDRF